MKNVHGFSSLLFESAVIIESGLLYTLAWVRSFVLYSLFSRLPRCLDRIPGIIPSQIERRYSSNGYHRPISCTPSYISFRIPTHLVRRLQGIVPTLIIVTISAGLSPVRTVTYLRPPRFASTNPHASHLNTHDIETEINFSNAQTRTNLSDMNFAVNLHDRAEASPTSDAKSGIEVEVEVDVKRDVYAV